MTILNKLRNRELGITGNQSTFISNQQYYSDIYPTTTTSVKVATEIRKFSPCGQYLIAFSHHFHALCVYDYDSLVGQERGQSLELNGFFPLRYERILTAGPETLCQDFCLFTADKRHIILSSAVPSTSSSSHRNPESLICLPALDDVTFWILELTSGKITEKKTLYGDCIFLSHHAGVHLYQNYFAVTSVQNQCIYIYQVRSNGTLVPGMNLGWMTMPDDEMVLNLSPKLEGPPDFSFVSSVQFNHSVIDRIPNDANLSGSSESKLLSGLKQRMMSFLFKRARNSSDRNSILHFYLTFDFFASLVMWRMQFLDSDNIMIKYGNISNIQGRSESGTYIAFYVFYCLSTTQVTDVFENSSIELFEKFENMDCFRGTAFPQPFSCISSVSNNKYSRDCLRKQLYTVRKARNGGALQAIKRILSVLPLNAQSFSESPYFNSDLFSFDEKFINPLDRYIELIKS